MVSVENKQLYTRKIVIKSDERFDVDELMNYCLCLQFGIKDLQLCVIDKRTNTALYLEDYELKEIRSIQSRLNALRNIFDDHSFLRAGFWKEIRITIKTHKFSLVPSSLFYEEVATEYLAMNAAVKPQTEGVYFYKHHATSAYNVFAADRKLASWCKSLYPSKKVILSHQGSAIIQGILKYKDHTHEKTIFCLFDKNVVHVTITWQLQLLYYNQFAAKQPQDFLKYVMLVFREFKLSQKTTKTVFWGTIGHESSILKMFKKYIKNISFGHRPSYLKFPYQFDEVSEHQYFDCFSTYFCD